MNLLKVNLFKKKAITLFKLIIYFLFIFVSPLLLIFIYLISPLVIIKVIPLLTNRFGHLSLNPEIYLLEKKFEQNQSKKIFEIFFSSNYGICNYTLLKMWKKKFYILPNPIIQPLYDLIILIHGEDSKYTVPFFNNKIRDINFYLDRSKPSIELSQTQSQKCEKILYENNININENKFICLFVRDDAYLDSFNTSRHKKNWRYLSHHNVEIDKFILTAKKLAERKIYVFRMGAKVEKKFNVDNQLVIDYANSNFRSELMDIYLASKCIFYISTGTGANGMAMLFRKPMVDLNANLHHLYTNFKDAVLLSKKYFHKKEKRFLKLKEILNLDIEKFSIRQNLENEGIEMIDYTSNEICDAVIEILERLSGKWIDNKEIVELQTKFKCHNWKKLVERYSKLSSQHYHGKIRANYSSQFLLDNKDWLN